MMDWPLKVLDLKPNEQIWGELKKKTDLLYIQRKAFGLSCRRHGITLVLKFSGNIDTMPEICAAVIAAKGGRTKS